MAIKCPKCHSENPDTSWFCGSCSSPLDAEAQGSPSVTKILTTPIHGLAKGTRVAAKYRILEEIGRGGMGIVYKAEDTKLQRTVALKFLPPQWVSDPEARERFIHEARAASALDHPNICTIYEIGETEDGRLFIAMGCYEGESLRDKLRRGPMKAEEALGVATQVALGMEKAHATGIAHRDIKPANILITNDGVAKIVDFGLAKLAGQVRMTKEGSTVGTVAYMSPEQAKGEPVDQRTDIWSLGVVLYEMVSGRLPFKGDYEQGLIHSILNTDPEPIGKIRKDFPKGLESIILKALAKNPNARYQGMGEVLEDLKAVTEGVKPLRAKSGLFRGKVFGIRKIYAYAGLACLGILASVVVLLIALKVGGLRERVLGRTDAPRITSLAVLPLKNFSGDPSQDFFADGMTDALIAGLAQIKAIKVISRTSVMQYKEARKPLPQIAKELGVEGIVEGSVMRSGNRVRITAQLIDARQDRHLWASNYEREMTDVLALQSEVVRVIAGEIRVQVTAQEQGRLGAARPVDPIVYDTTLRAMSLAERAIREQDYRRAMAMFQSALDKDPGYAPAWAGLGYATVLLVDVVPPKEVTGPAIAAAEKALALDPDLPEAHLARAMIATIIEWDLTKAQTHYERALELRPGYGACHGDYAMFLITFTHDFEKARIHMDRARELDPFSPVNTSLRVPYLYVTGHAEQAVEEGRRLFQAEPDNWGFLEATGLCNLYLQKFDEAVRDFEACLKVLPERPSRVVSRLGQAYGRAGRREDARRILAELEQASRRGYVSPVAKAYVYAGLGQNDEAFRLLEEALEARDLQLLYTSFHPFGMDTCVKDPRWPDLMSRISRAARMPESVKPGGKP